MLIEKEEEIETLRKIFANISSSQDGEYFSDIRKKFRIFSHFHSELFCYSTPNFFIFSR